MTAAGNTESTVRVIRGYSINLLTRCLEETATDISRWHEAFFDGVKCALKEQKSDSFD